MTDQNNPIADVTARLESRLTARLVDQIRPLLAGRSAEVRAAVLAALTAEMKEVVMVGSDHDFQWPTGYVKVIDHAAIKQLELIVGTDRIFRVNIDGVCALRVRLHGDAELVIRDFGKLLEPSDEPPQGRL